MSLLGSSEPRDLESAEELVKEMVAVDGGELGS